MRQGPARARRLAETAITDASTDYREAKRLLLSHSFSHENPDRPGMRTGFLETLRPYRGLRDENFHEVMQAIEVVADHLRGDAPLDREIVDALWGMCAFARHWGVRPDGMLRRNGLISGEDSTRLKEWVGTITYTVAMLLNGASIEDALSFADDSEE